MGVTLLGRHTRPACTQDFTRSLKLCEECRFNSCVCVFLIPWRSRGKKQWVVTSISHMGQMRDSDWSRQILLRSDWLPPFVAICTTPIDLRLVFTNFKVRTLFNVKDAVPDGLRTRVVYKFSCASCNACYVGETSRHFSTRVREHILSDRSSNVFKQLQSSEFCRASCTPDCLEILDSATTKYQAKLKEPCL